MSENIQIDKRLLPVKKIKLSNGMGLVGEFKTREFKNESEAWAALLSSYSGQYNEKQLRDMGWRIV